MLFPVIVVFIYWGQNGDGSNTLFAFVLPVVITIIFGMILRKAFKRNATVDMTGSMLICGLSWILVSAFGALPFVMGINSSCLNAYFETVSGFTTTGITVYTGLDSMPRSILFWRALTHWLGGIGILSFFLMITFRGGGAHHIFVAESHKIFSPRPVPGLFNTVRVLWGIYGLFTILSIITLTIEGMPIFDSICHSFAALSTGGFSPHDSSIGYYSLNGYQNYKLIEYTVTFFMMLGGMSFLVHYRFLTLDFKSIWDNIEVRYWWIFIFGFTFIIMVNHLKHNGLLDSIPTNPLEPGQIESFFRYTIFQVASIITTTGFVTKDIGSDFFPALSKLLFLAMMIIGGCVGSTAGGIKVLRIAIMNKLIIKELYKLRIRGKTATELIIDKRIVPDEGINMVSALFFMWVVLLLIGGSITALFSNQGPLESLSGMFSALGNIGPCYISAQDMVNIHPVVKITYIFGMLAGRLEILPILLLFSRKAWH